MRLILIRHGETDHNADGMVQGRADIPLNDLGRRQAAALADSLRHTPVRAVYTSPLKRARETAAIVAAALDLPVTVEPDLIEMDVGRLEGLSGAQMRERFPEFLAVWAGPEGPDIPMPGGESLRQVQTRAWAVVERLREHHGDETVVAASHNFVIATIVCRAVGVPLSAFRRMRHGVASRTVIDVRPDRTQVVHLNDLCHLERAGLLSRGPWERR
jgi:broad specificity phosphatase PhoE